MSARTGRPKLATDDVAAIVASPASANELAARFGVEPRHIRRLRSHARKEARIMPMTVAELEDLVRDLCDQSGIAPDDIADSLRVIAEEHEARAADRPGHAGADE